MADDEATDLTGLEQSRDDDPYECRGLISYIGVQDFQYPESNDRNTSVKCV